MAIVTIGNDSAKNVFAVQGIEATGKAVLVQPPLTHINTASAPVPTVMGWTPPSFCARVAHWSSWAWGSGLSNVRSPT